MSDARRPVAVSNPYFKLLVGTVTVINILALFCLAAVAFWGRESPNRAREALVEVSRYGFTTTLGAIVGLLGGRANPEYVGALPKVKK